MLEIPPADVQTDERLKPTLASTRESVLRYGYDWIESHAGTHPAFMTNIVFEQFRYTTTSVAACQQHRPFLSAVVSNNSGVLVSSEYGRSELFAMVCQFVLDWTVANRPSSQLITDVLMSLFYTSSTELQRHSRRDVSVDCIPVANPSVTLQPFVEHLVTGTVGANKLLGSFPLSKTQSS